jgi:hypothetical protein
MARGRRDGDRAAERVPDEVEAVGAEPADEPVGDRVQVEPGTDRRRLAEARHVDGDHAPAARERADHAAPDEPARRDAVQQHERVARALVVARQRARHCSGVCLCSATRRTPSPSSRSIARRSSRLIAS